MGVGVRERIRKGGVWYGIVRGGQDRYALWAVVERGRESEGAYQERHLPRGRREHEIGSPGPHCWV